MTKFNLTGSHAPLSASSAERWLSCPASAYLNAKQPPQPTGIYAAEGTVAHKIAEYILTKECGSIPRMVGTTHVHEGQTYKITEQQQQLGYTSVQQRVLNRKFRQDGHIIPIDQTMLNFVYQYCDYVIDHLYNAGLKYTDLNVESRIQLGLLSWGTCDAFFSDKNILHVIDLKFGRGKFVEAVDNKQLLFYALSAYKKTGSVSKTIKASIVQPRYPHPEGPYRLWDIKKRQLNAFEKDVDKATALILSLDEGNYAKHLKAGDHCDWCASSATCKALSADVESTISTLAVSTKTSMHFSPEEVAKILDNIKIAEAYFKAFREYAYKQATLGTTIPGYKLTEKLSNRKWKDTKQTEQLLSTMLGDIYEYKLKTPSQIESLFPAGSANKEIRTQLQQIVDSLTERTITGTSLSSDASTKNTVSIAIDESQIII